MNKIIKINAKSVQAVFMYIFGYLAIIIVELLSIGQSMGETSAKISFSFGNLAHRLPSLITSYVAIAFYTVAALGQAISKFKEHNEQYKDLEGKINEFTIKNYKPTIFNRYCMFINKKRKINAWKQYVIKKWKRLEKNQTYEDLTEWSVFSKKIQEFEKARDAGEDVRPPQTKSKYCIKRWKLETYFSDKYIEENIDRTKIRYQAINAGVVLGGCRANEYGIESDEYITTNKAAIVFIDRAPSSLMMMGTIAVITSFTIDAFSLMMHWTAWLMFVLKLITKIFSMINTIYNTTKYAEGYNQKVTMKDIRFRYGVCCEYEVWHAQELKRQEERKKKELEDEQNRRNNIAREPHDNESVAINGGQTERGNSGSEHTNVTYLPTITQLAENISTN
jgi:hypothetical protein